MRVTWLPDADAGTPPRVAFAVGRRVGSAVTRNRVRRQLRAATAEIARGLPPGAYLVAYRGTGDATFADLGHWVAEAARRAGASDAEGRP